MQDPLTLELSSLLVICAVAAVTPLVVGLLRIRVAEVVVLIAAGVVVGPAGLGLVVIDDAINLLGELGLGFLFFLAGLTLEQHAMHGRSGRLALIGWVTSAVLACGAALALTVTGAVNDGLGIAIALTSTALGTLLPILRESGLAQSRFGTLFMGAGAVGEFAPIIAMSLLLSSVSPLMAVVSLVLFAGIAVIFARVPSFFHRPRVVELIARQHRTTAETAVRLTILLLVALLAVAKGFGLDVVLGAFVAGIIIRRYAPPSEESVLQVKVEAAAFGFFIPIFFVLTGAKLDIDSILASPLLVVVFTALLLAVRGLPQLVVYRRELPQWRPRVRLSLYIATGLPLIVAVTTIQTQAGLMRESTAAALVGAGALSVLLFPTAAALIDRRGPQAVAEVSRADG